MPAHFQSFGVSHLSAMAAMFAAALALIAASRAANDSRFDRVLRRCLAAFLIADWALYLAMFYVKGWLALGNVLPLNLCDWATIAVTATLIRPNQKTYELSYFWALAGTLLASITPDLEYDFPDWRFLFFFFYHAVIIASVLYLTFGLGMRPVKGSVRRVLQWTLAYVAVAGTADWLLGTNYGFLRAKPQVATLFDQMAPWPWYIAQSFAVAVAAMLLLDAPFRLADRMRKMQARRAA
ncbi:MAG: TIGR02206 family membrane protein [Alphaproteobacteria bacterium]|nr:TIGR02206 family membrane protein [Alphaproteobacteria bacterium]